MAVRLDEIRQIVEQIVDGNPYELVDVELKGAGKHRVLRIFIDREGGISHEDCEYVSDHVGTRLDVEDLIPSSYTLEVSSPGLERKLVNERDFIRFEGHLAKIRTTVALDDQKVFHGRLKGVVEDRVRLESPQGVCVEIPSAVIAEARLEVDWEAEMRSR